MLEQAQAKLQAEMEKEKKNEYVQFIGQFLLGHLGANPGDAERILAADNTILKSLDAMKTAAQKKPRSGNVAMLTPIEGLTVVLKYFGIDKAPTVPVMPDMVATPVSAPTAPAAPQPAPKADFDISLDAYM